jgi:trans-AT polyketide synthase/acyltransferase/oxidoreductase domain-containing protein
LAVFLLVGRLPHNEAAQHSSSEANLLQSTVFTPTLAPNAKIHSILKIGPDALAVKPGSSEEVSGQEPDQILAALRDIERPLYAVTEGRHIVLTERQPRTLEGLAGVIPAVSIESFGAVTFRKEHNLRLAYVTGAMAGGIASIDLVVDMAQAGCLGFFGAGALPLPAIEQAIRQIQSKLTGGESYGVNLLHNYYDEKLEWDTVELYLRLGVTRVEAAAFVAMTAPLVHYRVKGIHRAADGRVVVPHHVFAKVSRPEVAMQFLAPPPAALVAELLAAGKITAEEAELAALIPMANELTCEADSGGHTDRRPLSVLFPMMLHEREQAMQQFGYGERGIEIHLGAAGGLGEPLSVHAAFSMGADYIVTGSINQACRQSGTAARVRQMLAEASMADVAMCPASDMFEMGGKVQVLKRGTMYPQRAQRLYELYKTYPSFEAIPEAERSKVEKQILKRPFAEVWQETEKYWMTRQPEEAERGRTDEKHRMALCFRWYLGMSSRWARVGEPSRQADFQIWCGPAIGGLNRWTEGTALALAENRDAPALARALLTGAAVLQRRELAARARVRHLPTAVAAMKLSDAWLREDQTVSAEQPTALAL